MQTFLHDRAGWLADMQAVYSIQAHPPPPPTLISVVHRPVELPRRWSQVLLDGSETGDYILRQPHLPDVAWSTTPQVELLDSLDYEGRPAGGLALARLQLAIACNTINTFEARYVTQFEAVMEIADQINDETRELHHRHAAQSCLWRWLHCGVSIPEGEDELLTEALYTKLN